MHIFYAPDINSDNYFLDEKESKHCIRVLRMSKGTPVKLIDGKGNIYTGSIADPDPRKCMVNITAIEKDFEKREYSIHIAISPLKNQERFEWFLEKSVEIGVDTITPLICKNTEKTGIKKERLMNIIISAMKQSLKAKLPVLNDPIHFSSFLTEISDGNNMIAHCNSKYPRHKISDIYKMGENAILMVGPEGDFSTDEIIKATERGVKGIHLGTSRLRTETAGIAACHSIYFINQ